MQIGAENAQLQKVLDTFDAIKTKVRLACSSSHLAPFLLHLHIPSSDHDPPLLTFLLPLSLSGHPDHLPRLRPHNPSARLPRLLDIRRLPDHTPSAGERDLDRLQGDHLRQPCPGKPTYHSLLASPEAICRRWDKRERAAHTHTQAGPKHSILIISIPTSYYSRHYNLNQGEDCPARIQVFTWGNPIQAQRRRLSLSRS